MKEASFMTQASRLSIEKQMNKIIIAYTEAGLAIARSIAASFDVEIFYKDKNIDKVLEERWSSLETIIFISATGIAVRKIAPLIKDKYTDPAVLVIDDKAKHVISLLSGHIGGANELAIDIAKAINAEPVITTASDNRGIEALDIFLRDHDFAYNSREALTMIMGAIVNNKKIYLKSDDFAFKYDNFTNDNNEADYSIIQDEGYMINDDKNTLYIIKKKYNMGIGLRRGTDFAVLEKAFQTVLKETDINPKAIKRFGSIDIKKDEEALLELCKKYDRELIFYTADELNEVDVTEKSDFVKKITGAYSVSEAAAKLLGGKIILTKKIIDSITFSITEEI